MRVVVLSEAPADLLAKAERERRRGAEEQLARVESLRSERRAALSSGRLLTWLRLGSTVRGAKREAMRLQIASALPTTRELAMQAGRDGERRLASELAPALDDEWILLRGYQNAKGEVDALLLGPRGLFAIEEKYRSIRVFITGDEWLAEQLDKYGRAHGARSPIRDNGGRSPSLQVQQPAEALSRWLSANRRGTPITPVVLLTHPNARVGSIKDSTVRVERLAGGLLALIERSRYTVDAERRADIERLIRRDHRFHEAKRASANGG